MRFSFSMRACQSTDGYRTKLRYEFCTIAALSFSPVVYIARSGLHFKADGSMYRRGEVELSSLSQPALTPTLTLNILCSTSPSLCRQMWHSFQDSNHYLSPFKMQ